MYTADDLIQFEEDIRKRFENSEIRAPIHLSGGNEQQLIDVFKNVKPTDWVFSTHRNHYHALLHGIDKDWLFSEIMAGRSMAIANLKHKFVTSSIVSGMLPIALGVALAIKREASEEHVWVFVGDMAALGGICHEVKQYASRHRLPLSIVVEDNGYSTNTPTQVVWGDKDAPDIEVSEYSYQRVYPHVGSGKWVTF